jgi:hypothetical protein
VRLFSDAVFLYNTEEEEEEEEEEDVHEVRFQILTAVLLRIKFFWVVIFCRLKYKMIGLPYTEQEAA